MSDINLKSVSKSVTKKVLVLLFRIFIVWVIYLCSANYIFDYHFVYFVDSICLFIRNDIFRIGFSNENYNLGNIFMSFFMIAYVLEFFIWSILEFTIKRFKKFNY